MAKPITPQQRRYIAALRTELGIEETDMPYGRREAMNLISSLLRRKQTTERPEPVQPLRERRTFRTADGSQG